MSLLAYKLNSTVSLKYLSVSKPSLAKVSPTVIFESSIIPSEYPELAGKSTFLSSCINQLEPSFLNCWSWNYESK